MADPRAVDRETRDWVLQELAALRASVGQGGGEAMPGDLCASVRASKPGWLLCDGATYDSAAYPALAAQLGATGATFQVPDWRGRTIVGLDAGQTEFDTMLEAGGAKTHTLTSGQIPPTVVTAGAGGTVLRQGGDNTSTGGIGPRTGGTDTAFVVDGGGGAHNNLQPYRVARIFIKT